MKTTRHLLWLWMALAGLGGPVVAGATGDGDSAAMLGCILEGMRQAESWSEAQFRQWGLTAVRRDPFEFGRGWTAVEWGRFLDTVS
jgi:hypothetical protein